MGFWGARCDPEVGTWIKEHVLARGRFAWVRLKSSRFASLSLPARPLLALIAFPTQRAYMPLAVVDLSPLFNALRPWPFRRVDKKLREVRLPVLTLSSAAISRQVRNCLRVQLPVCPSAVAAYVYTCRTSLLSLAIWGEESAGRPSSHFFLFFAFLTVS